MTMAIDRSVKLPVTWNIHSRYVNPGLALKDVTFSRGRNLPADFTGETSEGVELAALHDAGETF